MSWAAVIGAGVSIAGSAISSNQQKKALAGAANASQVDINKLDEQTRRIARQNAIESAELERQLTPEVTNLRRGANEGLLAGLTPSDSEKSLEASLTAGMNQQTAAPISSPLLQAAIARAKANLDLGGTLSQDVKNAATRRALSTAGGVSDSGLGLGRDLVARDLGLTSLDLENQRLAAASQLGGQELQLGSQNANIAFNNANTMLGRMQLLKSINDARFGRTAVAAQVGNSIAPPVVGLDPTALANLTVGNANNAGAAISAAGNQKAAAVNNYTQIAGNLVGSWLGNK